MYKNVLTIIIIRYKIFYKDRLRILFYMSSRFHQIVSNQNSPLPPPPQLGQKAERNSDRGCGWRSISRLCEFKLSRVYFKSVCLPNFPHKVISFFSTGSHALFQTGGLCVHIRYDGLKETSWKRMYSHHPTWFPYTHSNWYIPNTWPRSLDSLLKSLAEG